MKREIVVLIEGNISELLKSWKPLQDIEIEEKEPGNSLEMVKVYDFSIQNIKASEFLSLSAASIAGLEIEVF